MPCRETPCPQCPFARSTTKAYLDTQGDNGERFIGQALGPFTLPCHMQQEFVEWRTNPTGCKACAGAAIYRGHMGYVLPPCLPVLPADHEKIFSSPAQLLAHHRGIALEEAEQRLRETTPTELLRVELRKAQCVAVRSSSKNTYMNTPLQIEVTAGIKSEFEPLPPVFQKGNRKWTTVARTGNVVLLKVNARNGGCVGWEVCVIVQAPAGEIMGNPVPARERLPSSESWGSKGWSYSGSGGQKAAAQALAQAREKFDEIVAREALPPEERKQFKRRGAGAAVEVVTVTPPPLMRTRVRVIKPEALV